MGQTETRALFNAAKDGREDKVRTTLKKMKERGDLAKLINEQAPTSGETLLQVAVQGQHTNMVKMLLEMGADANAPNKNGFIPLNASVEQGNVPITKLLLEHGSYVNCRNERGETPLIVAVKLRNAAAAIIIVEMLLRKRANVNSTDSNGASPLHHGVRRGDIDLVRLLLGCSTLTEPIAVTTASASAETATINLDAIDKDGDTPLQLAIKGKFEDVAMALVSAGADVNKADAAGTLPLHYALKHGLKRLSAAIIASGRMADINAPSRDGDSPLVIAADQPAGVSEEAVDGLLRAGADVHAINRHGKSALHLAVIKGNKRAVTALVAAGANVNLRDHGDDTSLQLAVRNEFAEIAHVLLDHGAEVEVGDLMTASKKRSKKLMECLLGFATKETIVKFVLEDMSRPRSSVGEDDAPQLECKICFEKEVNTAYIPCGHSVVCTDCSKLCSDCPVCRLPYERILTIYRQ